MPNAYTLHRQRQAGKKPSPARTSQKVRVGPGGGRRVRKVGNETIDVATPAKVIGAAELQRSIELKDKEIEAMNDLNERLTADLETVKKALENQKAIHETLEAEIKELKKESEAKKTKKK